MGTTKQPAIPWKPTMITPDMTLIASLLTLAFATSCGKSPIPAAQELAQAGDINAAFDLLAAASTKEPGNAQLSAATRAAARGVVQQHVAQTAQAKPPTKADLSRVEHALALADDKQLWSTFAEAQLKTATTPQQRLHWLHLLHEHGKLPRITAGKLAKHIAKHPTLPSGKQSLARLAQQFPKSTTICDAQIKRAVAQKDVSDVAAALMRCAALPAPALAAPDALARHAMLLTACGLVKQQKPGFVCPEDEASAEVHVANPTAGLPVLPDE